MALGTRHACTATTATGTATPDFRTLLSLASGCVSEGGGIVSVRGPIIAGTAPKSHHPTPVSEEKAHVLRCMGSAVCSNRTATGQKGGVL